MLFNCAALVPTILQCKVSVEASVTEIPNITSAGSAESHLIVGTSDGCLIKLVLTETGLMEIRRVKLIEGLSRLIPSCGQKHDIQPISKLLG